MITNHFYGLAKVAIFTAKLHTKERTSIIQKIVTRSTKPAFCKIPVPVVVLFGRCSVGPSLQCLWVVGCGGLQALFIFWCSCFVGCKK